MQQFGLATAEADEILKASGLIVGENVNYFEVLGVSIDELENQDETRISNRIEEAHKRQYSTSLQAGGLPRPDGRTQEQWRTVLNQARDTLLDPQKRWEHISTLQTEILQPVEPIPVEEFTTPEQTSLKSSILEDMMIIPAGEFQMGNNKKKRNNRKKSTRKIYVDTFYIDKYPVTNAQYKMFIDANPKWRKLSKRDAWNRRKKKLSILLGKYHDGNYLKHWDGNNFPNGKADHPVIHVSWYAAMAYAKWIGKRLPTEAEWEKAARGELIGQRYPWGNNLDANLVYCGTGVGETTSVGKYPPNNYGLHDIVGNVWEWCLDEYEADFYPPLSVRNPVAGANTQEDLDLLIIDFGKLKTERVLRGGSQFTSSKPNQTAARHGGSPFLTTLFSVYSAKCTANIGIRCAWDVRLKS